MRNLRDITDASTMAICFSGSVFSASNMNVELNPSLDSKWKAWKLHQKFHQLGLKKLASTLSSRGGHPSWKLQPMPYQADICIEIPSP